MKRHDLMMKGGFVAMVMAVVPGTGQAAEGRTYYGFQAEQFEYRLGDENEKRLVWDADAFWGTDELKLRWQGEGERDLDADINEGLENRLVLQTPISDFFDAKAGVRLDTPTGTDRWYGTVGIMGLAPQWIEVDADLFVSETGDGSARLDLEYEGLITNRVILTPSIELNAAFSEDREIEVGTGISSAEIGLRLSYDLIDRSVAPYIGVSYERKFGDTADFAKEDGEDFEATYIVTGLRLMF
ncbi:copper resistance protein B [Thalassospira povalilytica]|uniref:Copper resistance protein B n=1 Tax=Thalassospira povalilytica TaxID=732237 RepID=A0ABX4RAW5_9PROT|nr:copper resistance protein B [Thalassospira povalilytica]PKR50855.1 copper resistance protein B [Thalassospira povalilytica]